MVKLFTSTKKSPTVAEAFFEARERKKREIEERKRSIRERLAAQAAAKQQRIQFIKETGAGFGAGFQRLATGPLGFKARVKARARKIPKQLLLRLLGRREPEIAKPAETLKFDGHVVGRPMERPEEHFHTEFRKEPIDPEFFGGTDMEQLKDDFNIGSGWADLSDYDDINPFIEKPGIKKKRKGDIFDIGF